MFRSFAASLRRFSADRSGAVALLVGVAIGILFMAAGAAIDFGRAYQVRQNLQTGLDTAARTVGASSGVTAGAYVAQVTAFLRTNNPVAGKRGVTLGTPTVTYDPITRENVIVHEATIDTDFLRLFGMTQLTVHARVTMRQASYVQVALAIDMSDSNVKYINNIRTASNSLINTLFNRSTTGRVPSVSVVPFADYVNIGNAGTYRTTPPRWLKVLPPTTVTTCPQDCTAPAPGCLEPSPDGVMVPCKKKCVNRPGAACTTTKQVFNGCVSPREIPNPLVNRSVWEQIAFNSSYDYPYVGNRKNCGTSRLLELSPIRQDALDAIAALDKVGTLTHMPTGLIWAWNVLDRAAPLSPVPDPYMGPVLNPAPNKYGLPVDPSRPTATGVPNNVVVLLSDGVNKAVPLQNIYYELGEPPVGSLSLPSLQQIDDVTKNICANMRAANIEIFSVFYTPGFITPADTVRGNSVMSSCASPAGARPGSTHFFYANNAATLQSTFDTIADMISNVRLIN